MKEDTHSYEHESLNYDRYMIDSDGKSLATLLLATVLYSVGDKCLYIALTESVMIPLCYGFTHIFPL